MQQGQSSQATGTRNETYDLVSVLYHALQGAENCQTYLQDASQGELRSFFEQALSQQRQLADQAKQLLQQHLQNEGSQSGSAFGFRQDQPSSQSDVNRQPSFSGQPGGGTGGGSSGGSF
jgi:hypothetical protein